MLPKPAQIPRVNSLLKHWGVRVHGSLYDEVTSTRHAVRQTYKAAVIEVQ